MMTAQQSAPPGVNIARIGYEAYGDAASWQNYEGKPMPTWDELPAHIQAKWNAAAKAIALEILGRPHFSFDPAGAWECPKCNAALDIGTGGDGFVDRCPACQAECRIVDVPTGPHTGIATLELTG